ncbi:MAG: glycosyltransferase family 8 protein [Clostridiales bacterium]|nr:glycosyltransferase family 8 protein [Clostridiales bacterium]
MNVVYASNDAYARHLGVSMCSLFDKNPDEKEIRVFVLSMGLSTGSRRALGSIAKQYQRELSFLEMDDLKERLRCTEEHPGERMAAEISSGAEEEAALHESVRGCEPDTGVYDISIMLRLFMGEALPEDVERVLYLDCDTVVAQPIGALWRTDLLGNVVGAVMEPTIYPEVKEAIGLAPEDPYFNSGVLLADLRQWRKTGVQKALLDFWRKKSGRLFASDQDVINGTLAGRVKILSPRYNFFPNYRYFSYATLARHAASWHAVSREEFAEAKRHPAIIHYMGDDRPWIAGNRNHYRRAYEKYLEMTPWAGTPREEGKRFYMLLYHLMDYTTAVCPAMRWEISRRMGMKWAARKK